MNGSTHHPTTKINSVIRKSKSYFRSEYSLDGKLSPANDASLKGPFVNFSKQYLCAFSCAIPYVWQEFPVNHCNVIAMCPPSNLSMKVFFAYKKSFNNDCDSCLSY